MLAGADGFNQIKQYLRFLDAAREIARYFDVNPPFDSRIDRQMARDVSMVVNLIRRGRYGLAGPGATFGLRMGLDEAKKLMRSQASVLRDAPISMTVDFQTRLFGAVITLPKVKVDVSHVKLTGVDAVRRRLKVAKSGYVKLVFMTTRESEIVHTWNPQPATSNLGE